MNLRDPEVGGIRADVLFENRDSIPTQTWIVPEFIPVGFSIIAGREKSGKSLMTFGSIAAAVSLGAPVMDRYPCEMGVVLYFALEEGLHTIVDRMERIFSIRTDNWFPSPNLRIFTAEDIACFSENGVDALRMAIDKAGPVRLVVIDTLRLLAPKRKVGTSSTDYDHEYEFGNSLQQLALSYNIAIVALHHTTKSKYVDVFDSIAGTAWPKSAEMMAIIEREGSSVKLHVRGRSIASRVGRLSMDGDSLRWTARDDDDAGGGLGRGRPERTEQIAAEDVFEGASKLRYSEIVRRFQAMSMSEATARRWIDRKMSDGHISKCTDGSGYTIGTTPDQEPDTQQQALWSDPTAEVPPPSLPLGNPAGGGDTGEPVTSLPPPLPLGIHDGGGDTGEPMTSLPPPSLPLGDRDGGGAAIETDTPHHEPQEIQ